MKERIVVVMLSLTLLFLSHSTYAEEKKHCQKTLKIGVSLPLTAGAIASGQAVKNSIILADEKYDIDNCVEFIFENDQLLAKNTLSIVNRLIDIQHVDGLIVYGTSTSIAVRNVVEKHKIPMIVH